MCFTEHFQDGFLVLVSLVVLLFTEAKNDVVGPPDLDRHADVEVDHQHHRHQEKADRGDLEQWRVNL